MLTQRGFAPILIILLISAAIGGYLVYSGKIDLPQKQNDQSSATAVDETADEAKPLFYENWKTYTNQKHKFDFKYPEGWTIKEEIDPRRAFGLMSTQVSAPSKQSFIDIVVQAGTKEQIEKELGNNPTKDSMGNITVWVQETGGIGKVYSFPSIIEGQIINIVYGVVPESPKSEVQVIDQILSTFKFTQ